MNDSQAIYETYAAQHLTGESSRCVIDSDGNKRWWLNNKIHRDGGPAVEKADGKKYWAQNGSLHREDGPAVVHADDHMEWYLNGSEYSMYDWAMTMLRRHNKPADPKSVQEFLRPILAKQTKDLI